MSIECGIVTGGDHIDLVIGNFEADRTVTVTTARTLTLGSGTRAAQLCSIAEQLRTVLREANVENCYVRGSAYSMGMKLAHLESAEVRGIAVIVAGSVSNVTLLAPAVVGRTFGDRKPQEYLSDNSFWKQQGCESLAKKYRQACLQILAGNPE